MTTTQALRAFIESARILAAANDNALSADIDETVARAAAERRSGDGGRPYGESP